ncbi:hypothetical protein KVT40_002969 [Elsinoe batatas]|uniref:Methyltransferase n=1 Tax=Elsinoe batatas TaxID=2601811 RepID=A0A8K0L3N2_9PEZI|nr:hypothetical protein KVT40_002969 [Elsinoe batatas]
MPLSAAMGTHAIRTYIGCLDKLNLYQKEKPYEFRFTTEGEGPRKNLHVSDHEIIVEDVRPQKDMLSLDRNGFLVLDIDVDMLPDEFSDRDTIISNYIPYIADAVQRRLAAKHVQVHDYLVRKSDASFPISTGAPYQFEQPSMLLHIDSTPEATAKLVRDMNDDLDDLMERRCQYVTVWRPLKGPVRRWPMTLCDNRTVMAGQDLAARDMIYLEGTVVETHLAHFSSSYKFCYLSDQMPNEAWVMLQSDSQGLTGVPHCSFNNPEVEPDDPQRESIEIRMLVYY